MEKYIKAETVLKFINGCLEHEDKITDTEKAVLTGVKTCIERISAADVKPVVHGTWVRDNIYHGDDTSGFVDPAWHCSNCGQSAPLIQGMLYDLATFCPNCGADMRKEKKYGDCD